MPMKKAWILLILGIWVATLPYLGFPYSWKDILETISGFGLIIFSYVLYNESKIKQTKKEKVFDNFSENNSFDENEMETIDTEVRDGEAM